MRTFRHVTFTLALFTLILPSLTHCEPAAEHWTLDGKEVEPARYAKAFVGSDNISIELAPYKVKNSYKRGAIIVIHGIDSDWDGKPINHEFLDTGYGGWEYFTQVDGKHYTTLSMKKHIKDEEIHLYFPSNPTERTVVPSDGLAQQVNMKAIYLEYQKLQKGQK